MTRLTRLCAPHVRDSKTSLLVVSGIQKASVVVETNPRHSLTRVESQKRGFRRHSNCLLFGFVVHVKRATLSKQDLLRVQVRAVRPSRHLRGGGGAGTLWFHCAMQCPRSILWTCFPSMSARESVLGANRCGALTRIGGGLQRAAINWSALSLYQSRLPSK